MDIFSIYLKQHPEELNPAFVSQFDSLNRLKKDFEID